MKTVNYILVMLVALSIFGCQKDPLTAINDGSWNKERNIIGISFVGQVGKTTIVRNEQGATIVFKDYADDFSAIKVNSLEVSYGATASVKIGETLDFNNAGNTATITVTPANGDPFVWTVKADKFVNPYKGTWSIQNFKFKWDDWNGWGLAGEANVADKFPLAASGSDDMITFGSVEGVDPSGALFGSYVRANGADAAFGAYTLNGTDWSFKFGQLPGGTGKYFINPDNSVSVQINGSATKFVSKGSKETDGTTMTYQLDAKQDMSIDWNDYYSTVNQLKTTFDIWYVLKKQ